MLLGDRVDESAVLGGGEGAGSFGDDLGKLGLLTRVERDDPVPDRSLEHFRTLAGDRPPAVAVVTHRCTSEGRILPICFFPKNG